MEGMRLAFALLIFLLSFFSIRLPAQVKLGVADLPNAPAPQNPSASPLSQTSPCPSSGRAIPAMSLNAAAGTAADGVHLAPVPCTRGPLNWYQRFVNGPHDKPLTPRDKAWLAVRNIADPFNLITVGGEAGISVGADSHSPYGPGMPGYARYVGVSITEDMTGEFFGTFLIPSITRQDPHYYRMDKARIPRRISHAMLQVVWTLGDNGKGMLNYANLVGFAADDGIANLYVPGRETDVSASFQRYGISLATAPIGNFVDEFLPDLASHIHVQIVILQRIINQVASKETMNASNSQ